MEEFHGEMRLYCENLVLTDSRNRGDLAEGWYDPNTFEKARDSAFTRDPSEPRSSRRDASLWKRRSGSYGEDTWRNRLVTPRDLDRVQDTQRTGLPEQAISPRETTEDEEEDGDEESYGPQIPTEHTSSSPSRAPKRIDKSGPKIPTIQDLQLQRESHLSSLQETREAQRLSHKQSLKSHKSHLHQFEEETAPRAEPGTRERRLEKRREVASSNRAFAESRRGASPGEAPEAELMGDEGGDLETLKRQREKEVRKKNEREIRKEELLRARAAEREERLKSFRRKEEETMSYLRALAKEKFG
ncbi:hypothetical protein PRK78_000480 [Emydomyces testavorans]|uniref:Uncharacterized protein n=1 Tax=Emydomyces testavorans TaxID=2070801 RepID=A0AAF0DAS7_9EURO|nr:hypothetical protein PRK78_000480 [Emydomyces testavorans]